MVIRVLPDANTWFPRTLRDWILLLRLKTDGELFAVTYTEDILAETLARFRDRYPKHSGRVITQIRDRVAEICDERIEDFSIDSQWPGEDGDGHVHSAARDGRVDILVTSDGGWDQLTDSYLDSLTYEVHNPDSFLCLVDDLAPKAVRNVTEHQARYWVERDGRANLPARLRNAGCPDFAERVLHHLNQLGVIRRPQ